jgi:MULE transposase domain
MQFHLLAFVLMEDREKEDYELAFREFRKLAPNFKPTIGYADYEEALSQALLAVFGEDNDFRLKLCWFHYYQVSFFIPKRSTHYCLTFLL